MLLGETPKKTAVFRLGFTVPETKHSDKNIDKY